MLVVGDRTERALLLEALESGADGYVSTDASVSQLVDGTKRVGAGDAFVPPQMLGELLRWLIDARRHEEAALERFSRLSRREKEILGLLVAATPLDAIADRLVISPDTARTHVQNLLKKLEVHSRVEAVALAMEHGFAGVVGP